LDLIDDATAQAKALCTPRPGFAPAAPAIQARREMTRRAIAALAARSVAPEAEPRTSAVIDAWSRIRSGNGSEEDVVATARRVTAALGLTPADLAAEVR
jgi:hypothetical protein